MRSDFLYRFCAVGLSTLLFSGFAILTTSETRAASKELLTGQGGVAVPLQQVIRAERAKGPVSIAIPVAFVFGIGGERSPHYCSPSINAVNSSNWPIEELIVGIAYKNEKGLSAGSTISRFAEIKVGRQDTQYFYQLSVQDCRGLTGEVTVIRCMYTSGEDCLPETHVSPFGAIPLSMKPR